MPSMTEYCILKYYWYQLPIYNIIGVPTLQGDKIIFSWSLYYNNIPNIVVCAIYFIYDTKIIII